MCKTCDELLVEYKLCVSLFKDAVLSIPELLGDDSRVFLEYADRLRRKCNHARRALMKHVLRDHHSLAAKAASS
jgi:hypothetical protein